MTEPVPPADNEGTEGLPADQLPEDLEADELPAESDPGRRRPFNVGTLEAR